jgi:hypothetical protein
MSQTGVDHWLLPIGCTVLCNLPNLTDQHSPHAIFASASHVSWLDATQAWARMALGPVLSLSWVVPPPGCAMRFFLGFWASGHHTSPALLGSQSNSCTTFWAVISPPLLVPQLLCISPCVRPQGQEPKHSPSASSSFLPRLSSLLSGHPPLPSSVSILFSPFLPS